MLWFFTLYAYSQEINYNKIEFQDQPEWNKVLRQAQHTGKVIFVDCYTTWCGPCKRMEKEVFVRANVANFFNQKFLNVKYDMEAGEGVRLKKQYGITAYPTYLFIDGNGNVLHKIIGAYTEGDDFLNYAVLAVTPGENYADLQQRYKNGERNSALMFSYLRALKLSGEQEKEAEIVNSYLSLMNKEHFMDRAYWEIIKHFMKDPLSGAFKILLENKAEIMEVNGKNEVNSLIYSLISEQVKKNIAGYPVDGINFDRKAETALIELMKKYEFPNRRELLARSMAAQYFRKGEWSGYALFLDTVIDFRLLEEHTSPLEEINYFTRLFVNVVLDKTLLEKALRWSEYTCQNENNPSERAKYLETKVLILEKLGRKAEVEEAKAEAARLR